MGFPRLRGTSRIQAFYPLLLSSGKSMVMLFGIFFITLVFLSSCAHYTVNSPVGHLSVDLQERTISYDSPERSDELFLVVAFSGGGTRAAALAYGILEALEKVKIPGINKPRTLLDEVDSISSVSGGSFTAAYYGLYQKRIFKDFKE